MIILSNVLQTQRLRRPVSFIFIRIGRFDFQLNTCWVKNVGDARFLNEISLPETINLTSHTSFHFFLYYIASKSMVRFAGRDSAFWHACAKSVSAQNIGKLPLSIVTFVYCFEKREITVSSRHRCFTHSGFKFWLSRAMCLISKAQKSQKCWNKCNNNERKRGVRCATHLTLILRLWVFDEIDVIDLVRNVLQKRTIHHFFDLAKH